MVTGQQFIIFYSVADQRRRAMKMTLEMWRTFSVASLWQYESFGFDSIALDKNIVAWLKVREVTNVPKQRLIEQLIDDVP